MNKKAYVAPDAEITVFASEDVITVSEEHPEIETPTKDPLA